MTETHLVVPTSDGGERTVRLSNPDALVWPDEHITKQSLAEYILAVADPFLRANGDRPVTLQRFRGGVTGEEFYTKNPPKGAPDWVKTTMCTYPSARAHPQVVIDQIATAVWAVQMNTVTFHPWPVRADNNDLVDELRIDLDPQPGRGFDDAVEAAHVLRGILADAGLVGWVKTSGNRGVHVFARLHRTHEFYDVRHAAIAIARRLVAALPDLTTIEWWKELRGEKVFVDFNQTNRDRTIAGAYSPRALAGAPVSMPVPWDRLSDVDKDDFTVRTVPGILAADGDAWAGMDDAPGEIATALGWWDEDVAAGLGELPYPPDYPKMPGEPPRVQPSRAKKPDAED